MSPEELVADDSFLAWYFKTDGAHVTTWEGRMAEDPSLRVVAEEAVKLLEALSAPEAAPSDARLAEARNRLMERITVWEAQEAGSGRKKYGSRFRWWASAAAVAGVAFLTIWLGARLGQAGRLYTTGSNESRRIELGDGSVVNLNSGSRLRVSEFEDKQNDREVWLDGEAYFEVKHLAGNRKFVVHSDGLRVEVLGTQFNVKKQNERTEVVLESGKVQLSASEKQGGSETVVMQPGELVEFSRTEGTFKKREVNPRLYTAWAEGKVVFDNATLTEVVDILTRKYGLEVEVEQGSELGEFNGVFPAGNAEVVLKALEKTYTTQIEVKDNKVRIRK